VEVDQPKKIPSSCIVCGKKRGGRRKGGEALLEKTAKEKRGRYHEEK